MYTVYLYIYIYTHIQIYIYIYTDILYIYIHTYAHHIFLDSSSMGITGVRTLFGKASIIPVGKMDRSPQWKTTRR